VLQALKAPSFVRVFAGLSCLPADMIRGERAILKIDDFWQDAVIAARHHTFV
jgi:hypothetical protein